MAGDRRGSAKSDPGAMVALLKANIDAGRMKLSDIPEVHRSVRSRQPGVVRGAPTHDLAYLLGALEAMGWKLVEDKPEGEGSL